MRIIHRPRNGAHEMVKMVGDRFEPRYTPSPLKM